MRFQLIATITMIVHFVVLAYIVAGGFLAWWRPWLIWPHLLFAGWGFSSVVFGIDCPLTHVEDWARRRAGEAGPQGGFIDRYLEGVIYPERFAGAMQLACAGLVLVSWVGAIVRWRRGR